MVITETPLRISFLGGNTDFPEYYKKYGGLVLTTTINKYIYCIVKKRFDDLIYVNYMKKEIVKNVSDIKHDLVREALKFMGITKGIEITFLSDVPEAGSGLGSSSTVLVGLLNALHHYKGRPVPPRQLAEEACKIEIDILKKPIGVQDQYIAAFGGLNMIDFGKKVSVTPIEEVPDLEKWLLLLYTGRARKSSKVLSHMKLDKEILDENKRLAESGLECLNLGWIRIFGKMVGSYWSLKKKLNRKVTNKYIDDLYDKAIECGAYGGKIVGAGNGGFLLLVIEPSQRNKIKSKLGLKELPFKLCKCGTISIFNNKI